MLAPGTVAIIACLAAALWAPRATAQTITDLGTLPGYTSSYAIGINASGQVVGRSSHSTERGVCWPPGCTDSQHAFLYSGGIMTDLGTLGGLSSYAVGINDSGQVIGAANIEYGGYHAFLYSNGIMIDLGTFGGDGSSANGINASGQVVGSANVAGWTDTGQGHTSSGNLHAFLYSGGSMSDLGLLGGAWSGANGINNSGQIVGVAQVAGQIIGPGEIDPHLDGSHPFLYSGGIMTDLGTLPSPFTSGIASGINAAGQVVGYSYVSGICSGVCQHAFLYSGGSMIDLGALPGYLNSWAMGINASGQVVGYSSTESGDSHAFLYSGGSMIDLNSLLPANSGWDLMGAFAINDSGQIVGLGTIDGQQHAFLLNLTSLSPSSATAGGTAFTLTVTGTGTNFVPGATVNWNGTTLAASYVSGTQMTASVPASLIAAAGTASVTVTANEGTLAGATFAIHSSRRLPGEPERRRNSGQRAEQ